MSEVINIKELNERIERESLFVDTLRQEIDWSFVQRTYLVGGCSGPCQNPRHHHLG